jgi:hypothetical protein
MGGALSNSMPRGGVATFDLSSEIGTCYGFVEDQQPLATSTIKLAQVGGEACRYASAANAIADFLERYAPRALILEAPLPLPAQTHFRSAAQQFGLRAIAFAEGWHASCAVSEIDVGTARSEVMGIRRMSRDLIKREVMRFVRARGISAVTSHAADAAIVWLWHRQRVRGIAPCAGPLWWERAA